MSQEDLSILSQLKSYLLLEYRIPVYWERSEFYKLQAIIESIKEGIDINPENSVDLIDITETTTPSTSDYSQITFARDKDGIIFAKIEGNTYHPIDITHPNNLLNRSIEYEKLCKSFWRRIKEEPYEFLLGEKWFKFEKSLYAVSDKIHLLHFKTKKVSEILDRLQHIKY